MSRPLTDYALYRWRFIIGYTVTALVIIALVVIAALYVPGGLSANEMKAAVTSNQLSIHSISPDDVIQLPYYLLQKASVTLLGLSLISIKLPSIILGVLSIAGIFVLLSYWFRRNVAVLTTLLVITTGQLLFMTQNGTAGIMYVFWPIVLLVAATTLMRQRPGRNLWLAILGISAALSLYTPLSVYVLTALAVTAILHPHVRHSIRRLKPAHVAIGLSSFLLLIAPLIYAIVLQPSLGLQLLGIPSEMPNWSANAMQVAKQYLDFVSPDNGILMTPVYGLGSMVLVLLGIMRLVTTKYTARSYMITAWVLFLIPALLMNPSFTSVTFVPILLLMGIGLEELLKSWYKLFPHNPYARFAGLLPLAILIGGMMMSGVERYFYGYHYDARSAVHFSNDLSLVKAEVARTDGKPVTLITNPADHPFYDILRKRYSQLTVTTTDKVDPAHTTLVLQGAQAPFLKQDADRIVTSRFTQMSDRIYVYNSAKK